MFSFSGTTKARGLDPLVFKIFFYQILHPSLRTDSLFKNIFKEVQTMQLIILIIFPLFIFVYD